MGVLRTQWWAVTICGALLVAPASLHAQQADDGSRAAARSLGTSGVEAFQRGDYQGASDKLEKAYRVLRVPSIGLWSARALVKLGQLVHGSERYREVTQLENTAGQVTIQKQAQADAATELNALTPRLPSVLIEVEGGTAGLILSIDGATISSDLIGERRPVDPGPHVIGARRGEQHANAEVKLAEGESKTVSLHFAAAPLTAPVAQSAPARSALPSSDASSDGTGGSGLGTQRKLALVAGGVGVVGIALGTVFGLKAKSKNDLAKQHCAGSSCTDQDGVTFSNEAANAGNLSTVAFIVGAVGVAGGAALWLSAPSAAPTAQVGLGFGTIEMRGQW
jgi:hypothetical protein